MPRFLILETLVHFLDTFQFLAGEIRCVTCRTARVNPVIAGEDSALIQMEFASGAGGLIDANRISGPAPADLTFGTLGIEGDRGTLRMTSDGRLWITEYGSHERQHEYALPPTGFKGDSVKALQDHLVHCLRTGRQAESEGHLYLKTVNVVAACYESAEKGVPVRLSKRCGEL
jgi:predicted dehydrogenase